MERNIKIDIEEFKEAHKRGFWSDETRPIGDYLWKITISRAFQGQAPGEAYLSQDEIDAILACEKDHLLQEDEYNEVSAHRRAGMVADKAGNIDEAVIEYTACIEKGESATHYMYHAFGHALERMIVMMHKLKDYEREKYYIERLLYHEDKCAGRAKVNGKVVEKYQQRLKSVTERINKQQ